MPEFVCQRCRAVFRRPIHLRNHSGSYRCAANMVHAALGSKHRRGLGQGGNARRLIGRRVLPFVKYLKDNITRCKESKTWVVSFVPFLPEYVARNVYVLARAVRAEADAAGLSMHNKSSLARLLAAVLAAALGFTEEAVKTFSVPSVPWESSYEEALHAALLRSWKDGRNIFNTHIRQSSCFSFVNAPRKDVPDKVRRIVRIMKHMVNRVDQYFQESRGKSLDAVISGVGWPLHGYTLCLARSLWTQGGFPKTLGWRLLGSYKPLDGAVGLLNGVSKLCGDDIKDLRRSATLLRLRVNLIAAAVRKRLRRQLRAYNDECLSSSESDFYKTNNPTYGEDFGLTLSQNEDSFFAETLNFFGGSFCVGY